MTIEIRAPQFPESVADGTVATWHKKPGEAVKRDELLVDIETDKVVLEVVAPENGVLTEIIKQEGETVLSKELVGVLEAGEAKAAVTAAAAEEAPAAPEAAEEPVLSPAVRKLVSEHGLDPKSIPGTGKGGRIKKEDVQNYLKQQGESAPAPAPAAQAPAESGIVSPVGAVTGREEKRVAMTRLRKRIAERLTNAQSTAAMLTTFNEVNMQPIIDLRKNYQEDFERTHGVRLGFMSMFVRASVEALKRFPVVNASIDGDDIVYHNYFDIGVAVSTERGLVVPVIKDADQKGLAEVESQIVEFGNKARDNKLSLEEISGGTFSITNGGVFGSLLSTPILNPPQTAILGMHKIQQRPMAVNGEVKILPMMYLALTYDHRLIDGKEAVQYLVTIKEFVEDPTRLLLDI